MSELSGIGYTLVTSPRIAESPSAVDEVTVQDALDTLSAKQDDIDVIGATPAVDNTVLVSGSGKDDLGGGTSVGITSTFDNLQWAFASDYTATAFGTADAVGTTTLQDVGAQFVTKGVKRGAAIINYDDRSIAEVLEVIDEDNLVHRVLNNGSNNDWTIGDNYTIHNIVQKNLSGGNQVAIDDLGSTISPVFPTAFTQVIITASSSATATSQEALEAGLFQGTVCIDVIKGVAGTGSVDGIPIGTRQKPSSNMADTKTIGDDRGIVKIQVVNPMKDDDKISGVDLSSGRFFMADSPTYEIDVDPSADVTNCSFEFMTLSGQLDGINMITRANVNAVTNVSGFMEKAAFNSTVSINGPTTFFECYDQVSGEGGVQITVGSHTCQTIDCFGDWQFLGVTGGVHTAIMSGGKLTVDGSGGTVYVRGTYSEEPVVTGNVTVIDQSETKRHIEVHQANFNRRKHDADANTITIYSADNVTPLHVFDADDALTDITPQ